MFGMGFTEILLILIIAIIFLGPERLPKVAVDVAKFLKSFKSNIAEAKESITQEIDVSELKNGKDSVLNEAKELTKFESFDDVKKELDSLKETKDEIVSFKSK